MKLPTFRHGQDASLDSSSEDYRDDQPVAEQLQRYAESLSPDEETLSRMGAAVRAAFADSVTQREAGIGLKSDAPAGLAGRRPLWSRRRALAAICAVAILTLSSFGLATGESGPGQPFYRLRLGIESVNLPPAGSQDRLEADLGRADARLNDIASSAAASDWNAAADAASAYGDVLATVTLPADVTAKAHALKHLDEQLARLEELRAGSHVSERAVLDRAIAALCELLGIPVPTPPDSASSSPKSHPTDHDRNGETSSLGPTGTDTGHGHGHSPEPAASHSPDATASPSDGGSGDSGGGHASMTPRPTDTRLPEPGQSPPPSDGH